MQSRGFTLIELMVAVAILAILLAIGVPSYQEATLGGRLRALTSELVSSTQLARSEAIKRNTNVSLCVSANGATCGSGDWNQGWIVLAGADVLYRHQAAPTGFKVISSSASDLVFAPTGLGATANTFTVCRATPTAGSQERVVTITAAARTSVSTTTTGTCP